MRRSRPRPQISGASAFGPNFGSEPETDRTVGVRSALLCVAVSLLTVTNYSVLTGCSPTSATPAPREPAPREPSALEPNGVVERVVDGDTIVVDFDGTSESLRLIGIDTPETVKPNSPVECFGPEASAFAKTLLPAGTRVQVVRDVEARDAYDRLLGYVYRAEDGLFVNLEIIGRGYATLLTFPPNVAHVDDFRAAAETARVGNLGLWAGCTG